MFKLPMHPSADPLVWLGRLEDLLCSRFRDLAANLLQLDFSVIREEIVEHVGIVLDEYPEKEEWDVADFIWRIYIEWKTKNLTLMNYVQPLSSCGSTVAVGKLEALRHLPPRSSVKPWDHAVLCAGELNNTMREALNLTIVSFKGVLQGQGIRRPLCGLPVEPEPAEEEVSHKIPDNADTWNAYLRKLELDVARLKKAVTAVKSQNMELAVKLAETQSDLAEAKTQLSLYQAK